MKGMFFAILEDRVVIKLFDRSGVRFRYPQNWTLETEESESGWVASLYSPGSAFSVVSLHEDEDDPSRLADAALTAMRETYPDLESDARMETTAKQPSIGYEVHFFTLDCTNTAWIRCLEAPKGCLLILSQFTDREDDSYAPVLKAIHASLEFEEA